MAQLIRGVLKPTMQQEQLLFMDCFGKRFDVYLSLTAGPTRADKITSTLAALTATEDAVKAYATANNHDITADLAAGAAAIATELGTPSPNV